MTPPSAPAAAPGEPEAAAESRVARKRRAARERIVHEAERLMRERPIDEVTVGDITDAADVGHGTFYLHFKSKYAVLVPITRGIAQQWDDAISKIRRNQKKNK